MGWLSFTLHLWWAIELQRRKIKVCQLSHKCMGTNESKFKTQSSWRYGYILKFLKQPHYCFV